MEWTRGPHCSAPRGVYHREWSGVRCRDLPEDGRIAQYPLQEVEQDHEHHSGLPGNNGAARNPSQEVEQDRGCCCVTPGSADPSAEVRMECLVVSYPLEKSLKSDPSKSPDEVFL